MSHDLGAMTICVFFETGFYGIRIGFGLEFRNFQMLLVRLTYLSSIRAKKLASRNKYVLMHVFFTTPQIIGRFIYSHVRRII